MKISVITVCFNSRPTIARTLQSVAAQTHPDIEHIVVDGASTDGTQDTIREHSGRVARFISERDRGIYDAMNKGIRLASGEVIGILNSDDYYSHDTVLADVSARFSSGDLDALAGDVVFFRPTAPDKIVRRYRSQSFSPDRFRFGIMPAHPALFMKRSVYERTGPFQTDYKIAADFEFLIRAFKSGPLSYRHVAEVFVTMQLGGISTAGWRSTLLINREMLRACRENGIETNMINLLTRYRLKLQELVWT